MSTNRGMSFNLSALGLSGSFGYTAATALQQAFDPAASPVRTGLTALAALAIAGVQYYAFKSTAELAPARASHSSHTRTLS